MSSPLFHSLPPIRKVLAALGLCASLAAAQSDSAVFMRLFDGQTLDGWKGRKNTTWTVKSGVITGSGALSGNTFLIPDSQFNDFHLVLDARMPTSGYRNSGVVYRGEIMDTTVFRMRGYQLDISDTYWGSFYHEQGNELGWTPVSNCGGGAANDWHTVEIVADGPKVTHLINGKKCWEKTDFKVLKKGYLGLQMHEPGGFTMEFRNIYIRPLNNSFKIPEDGRYLRDGTHLGPTAVRSAARAASRARLTVSLERGLSIESRGADGRIFRVGLDGRSIR
jgi:hypothetical protein